MESLIERGLTKIMIIAKNDEDLALEEQLDFLLTSPKDKVLFLQNSKNYKSKSNATKIADLILFENDIDVQYLIGKNSLSIDNLCKEHLENTDLRRQLQVVLNESTNLYSKSLNVSNDNIHKKGR